MRVHQCYLCDLRFMSEQEVRDHLVVDHKVDPEKIDHHYAALPHDVHPHRHPPDAAHER